MTVNPKKRPPIHGHVTQQAHDGWHDFAANHGPTVSALLEVIGGRLADGETKIDMKALAREALQIDVAHRRRNRGAA